MVLQALQPRVHHIVYEMASTAKQIPLKGGVESLGDVTPTIGDNSREVHMQFEQMALFHSKPSNEYKYTTMQQLGNVIRRGEIWHVTEACREYAHLDGQLANLPPNTIPAPDATTPRWGQGTAPNVDPMGCHSEVLLDAPGMPKIASEGVVGVLPGLFFT